MKTAVFVEGQTEAVFVKRLIEELAGHGNVLFSEEKYEGQVYHVLYSTGSCGQQHEALIVNCCNDSRVVSAIVERHQSLLHAGYTCIIGVRDLYPLQGSQLLAVEAAVAATLPKSSIPITVVIAVMEVEAWFIEEETHFARIDPSLTCAVIRGGTSYDITSGMSESIGHPARLLHDIYALAGLAYRKKRKHVERTIEALDYTNLYIASQQRSGSLAKFIGALEQALL